MCSQQFWKHSIFCVTGLGRRSPLPPLGALLGREEGKDFHPNQLCDIKERRKPPTEWNSSQRKTFVFKYSFVQFYAFGAIGNNLKTRFKRKFAVYFAENVGAMCPTFVTVLAIVSVTRFTAMSQCLYNRSSTCPSTSLLTHWTRSVITSAEEGGYVFGSVCLSVCLSVRRITRKLVNGFWRNFSEG